MSSVNIFTKVIESRQSTCLDWRSCFARMKLIQAVFLTGLLVNFAVAKISLWKCPKWPIFIVAPCPKGELPGSTCRTDSECSSFWKLCCMDWHDCNYKCTNGVFHISLTS
ncbi:uncharacterized protein LOC143247341 [Tachypleus tridentatus]|uniref:uncharacterized protein LOC143247341 n=1 Tax=Tachypleus tridentatus TaxID=6853 RepID=UPI003FD090E9